MKLLWSWICRAHHWLGIAGWALLLLVGLLLLASWMPPHDPYSISMSRRLQPSSAEHWLGTDGLGRDLFSRLLAGGRNTLGASLLILAAALMIGVPIGLLSGYAGGWVDRAFMRLADSFMAFPDFLFAIVLSGLMGPHIVNLMLAIALVKWIAYARIVRNVVRSEKSKDYITVAKLNGLGPIRLMTKHLLPHALRHVLVLAGLDTGKIILMIAALSYIGLGVQPPEPEWGSMLNEGRVYFRQSAYLMIWPGLAIMLAAALANLTGDHIRTRLGTHDIGGRNE
ncbi:nickel transporter permease [Paenibacillus sp. SYP-B4298]|uniref:nickel transporter permease n=1 Tax=Paenibacillus sp. SYP-B4298 TaxID=2996034 RepID=UPI0022DD1B28|nr:nickel transporter permease [Paenibacillus sp. SYP-B4298]